MPDPCAPFDGGGVKAVYRQFFTDFFEHPKFHLAQAAIGGGGVTGKGVSGFIQAFGKRVADQAEEGI